MERRDLEGLTREELIAHAEALGVPRPRVLTQPELIDEILTRSARTERERTRARGFLGRARDLLARVVERGLHLPEAARALRGTPPSPWPPAPPPLPTVTLAEIYAAQGHLDRAIAVLDEVLSREPDHDEARALRARLQEQAQRGRGKRGAEPGAPAQAKPADEATAAHETAGGDEAGAAAQPTSLAAQDSGAAQDSAEGDDTEAVAAPSADTDDAAMDAAHDSARTDEPAPDGAGGTEIATADPPDAAPEAIGAATAGADWPSDEDAPLPERYDVDEIVGMAVDPVTLYLYWEVRPTTLAQARARRPDGHLVLRLVAVLPRWNGPQVEQRDIPVDALFGDRFVRDVPPGSNVRLSVGWTTGEDFEPFAVGLEIAAPSAFPSTESARSTTLPARTTAEPTQGGVMVHRRPAFHAGGPTGVPRMLEPAPPQMVWPFRDVDIPALAGPARFPSGVIPTPEQLDAAVAATRSGAAAPRGGSSELGPGGASELFRGAAWSAWPPA